MSFANPDSDIPEPLEPISGVELKTIHRLFDESDDLQLNAEDYRVLTPALPYEDEQLVLDALYQAELAEQESDLHIVESMLKYVRQVLIDNKIIL